MIAVNLHTKTITTPLDNPADIYSRIVRAWQSSPWLPGNAPVGLCLNITGSQTHECAKCSITLADGWTVRTAERGRFRD